MDEYKVGDIVKAVVPSGDFERFKVTKVGRIYVYAKSDEYGSDGNWRFEKDDTFPIIKRC